MKETKLSFQRYEKKYLMTAEKYELFWKELSDKLHPDVFCRSTVCSLYYDTKDYSLIRQSIEKPMYKEKLRLRSYGVPGRDTHVFVELKKKFKGIVYKRRIELPQWQAEDWLSGRSGPPDDSQISRELDWVLKRYELEPKVIIICDREAWVANENPELRFTFDKNLRYRETELELSAGAHGETVLDESKVLMEIKIPGAAPIWLADMLSQFEIFPAGFSKYGTCYKNKLLDNYFSGVMEIV